VIKESKKWNEGWCCGRDFPHERPDLCIVGFLFFVVVYRSPPKKNTDTVTWNISRSLYSTWINQNFKSKKVHCNTSSCSIPKPLPSQNIGQYLKTRQTIHYCKLWVYAYTMIMFTVHISVCLSYINKYVKYWGSNSLTIKKQHRLTKRQTTSEHDLTGIIVLCFVKFDFKM
jgi:hypothetical protein